MIDQHQLVHQALFNALQQHERIRLQDRTVRLWNPHTGFHVKEYTGHGYGVHDVAISKDNRAFASGGSDRQLFLWDVSTGRTVRKFRGHDGAI